MSGFLAQSLKHVVMLEVQGPLSKKQYEEFRAALETFAKDHKARVVMHARGKKTGAGGAKRKKK
ncbi:MAG: hypothetical protein HYU41_22885 [Candidatus Rokubacteria bacterium]|nr:hypothetical protein [Candidatus Rokubacteria bacterium]